ncbi:MAG: VOC family protein [Alphaproteobacteria bacterium]|nr:VOC family protein [Alphaproteobacteria bacterium]
MSDLTEYEARREALRENYLSEDSSAPVSTAGVDHLALICSDMDATVRFYTEVLDMRLAKVITNRDDPTSTHVFLDMGGGNMLAFFDFPEHGPAPAVRGVGAMHHVALKAEAEKYRKIVQTLKARKIDHSIHGSEDVGSVYLRDPDNILVEVTTGY